MEKLFQEGLGIAAGCLTTASYLPQVLHTWRSRSVSDISLRMYVLLCSGVALWLLYGVVIDSIAVMAANGVSLVLTLAIMAMKVRFGRDQRTSGDT
ncbi:SemiSWEET family sugar transporter [Fundidesulfovibrio soli]|uniref:SemiSWEET family sugar transporter n=1 Tax=Fundidesulfovibrio soli TaxID=2922716 RepID=UPI001FB03479